MALKKPIRIMHDEEGKLSDITLQLPLQVLTTADISRLTREAEELGDFFTKAATKRSTSKEMPQISRAMEALAEQNKLNLLHEADRKILGGFLGNVLNTAPVVHLSFAVEPRPETLAKLMEWFRREANPSLLFKIGLQPALAAGCVVRTTNKVFNFSFRRRFEENKDKLATALRVE